MTAADRTIGTRWRLSGPIELVALGLSIALVCVAVLAVPLSFRPFYIPASSMMPALRIGDYFVVSKAAYGFTRYGLPFGDLIPYALHVSLFPAEPRRGDVAVFKLPRDVDTDFVKRIVGLPGDRIQMVAGVLTINGEPVRRTRVADAEIPGPYGNRVRVPQHDETLPGGATYRVIEGDGDNGFWDRTEVYTVPPGHLFTLGDNRDNSTDSRDLANVGYVPIGNLIGRAELVLFSLSKETAGAWLRDRFLVPIR